MDNFFKKPDHDKIDKEFLTQLMYDGQMEDDEIEETVEVIMEWKRKQVRIALASTGVNLIDQINVSEDFDKREARIIITQTIANEGC